MKAMKIGKRHFRCWLLPIARIDRNVDLRGVLDVRKLIFVVIWF
jgi:hypothetical protein